jgi:hypothetical protein
MLGSSSQHEEEHAMRGTKKLAGLCVGLMIVIIGSIAMAQDSAGGKTKVIKSKASGTFVAANLDFDHANLTTPADYINSAGIGNVLGKFTIQGVNEFAPDGHSCTVPGGVAGAGTEFTLVKDVDVLRITATGDLLFFNGTSATACQDFSTFPTPPIPFIITETGVVTGGTGAFSGATGTFTNKLKGAGLSVDATGVRGFGWFKSTAETTVTVP